MSTNEYKPHCDFDTEEQLHTLSHTYKLCIELFLGEIFVQSPDDPKGSAFHQSLFKEWIFLLERLQKKIDLLKTSHPQETDTVDIDELLRFASSAMNDL